MTTAIKILLIVVTLLLLFFPLLPLSVKLRKLSTFRSLRYDAPHNRKNSFFVLLALIEFAVLAILYGLLFDAADGVASIGFVAKLLSHISSSLDFQTTVAVRLVFLNLVALYGIVILKAFFKLVLDVAFGFRKKKKKKKPAPPKTEETAAPVKKKPRRISEFFRTRRKKKPEEAPPEEAPDYSRKTLAEDEKFKREHPRLHRMYMRFWGLFFEQPDFKYARRFVHAATSVVQFFIYTVEIFYAVFFLLCLLAVFFPVPDFLYTVLSWFVKHLYIYPFISIIFLQELCNTFRAPCKPPVELS